MALPTAAAAILSNSPSRPTRNSIYSFLHVRSEIYSSNNNSIIRYIFCHHRSRTYNGILADCHTRKNSCSCTYPRTLPDNNRLTEKNLSFIRIMVIRKYLNIGGDGCIVLNGDTAPKRTITSFFSFLSKIISCSSFNNLQSVRFYQVLSFLPFPHQSVQNPIYHSPR